MERDLRNIEPGTRVYSSDNENIGEVEEVGPAYLLTRKGWFFVTQRYIPFDAVSRIEADGVYLTVAKAQLDAMAWDEPPAQTTSARATGASTFDADMLDATLEQRAAEPVLDQGVTTAIPVVADESSAGESDIRHGSAWVGTRVDDAPEREPVTLRGAVVDSERRAIDPVAGGNDIAAFQEGTFEVRAMYQEVIVGKQARVVEEIVLKKNVVERVEIVHDTVRRTRVDVEEVTGQTTIGDATTGVVASSTVADTGAIERDVTSSAVKPSVAADTDVIAQDATTGVVKSSTAADEGAIERDVSKARKRGGRRGRRRLP